jgi:hypothetical protein
MSPKIKIIIIAVIVGLLLSVVCVSAGTTERIGSSTYVISDVGILLNKNIVLKGYPYVYAKGSYIACMAVNSGNIIVDKKGKEWKVYIWTGDIPKPRYHK